MQTNRRVLDGKTLTQGDSRTFYFLDPQPKSLPKNLQRYYAFNIENQTKSGMNCKKAAGTRTQFLV